MKSRVFSYLLLLCWLYRFIKLITAELFQFQIFEKIANIFKMNTRNKTKQILYEQLNRATQLRNKLISYKH